LPGTYVSIFLTGEGVTEPLGVDGSIAAETATVGEAVSVRIAGRPARVLYAGAVPGNVRGFAQLNVVIPRTSSSADPSLSKARLATRSAKMASLLQSPATCPPSPASLNRLLPRRRHLKS